MCRDGIRLKVTLALGWVQAAIFSQLFRFFAAVFWISVSTTILFP